MTNAGGRGMHHFRYCFLVESDMFPQRRIKALKYNALIISHTRLRQTSAKQLERRADSLMNFAQLFKCASSDTERQIALEVASGM